MSRFSREEKNLRNCEKLSVSVNLVPPRDLRVNPLQTPYTEEKGTRRYYSITVRRDGTTEIGHFSWWTLIRVVYYQRVFHK